jgi:hypothetical protein
MPNLWRRFSSDSKSSTAVPPESPIENVVTLPYRTPTRQTLTVERKVFWPRDLLPNDIPDARIYTYGYDADVIGMSSSKGKSGTTFTNLAQNMLMDLDRGLEDNVIYLAQF